MVTTRKAKPAAKASVSAHPLFPAIVALWFAALLGIGTMVLPQTLFDKFGTATGMGSLGMSFRLGLGLAAGAVGAIAGVLLARKVAASQVQGRKPAAATRQPSLKPAARKPISALEELGSEGLDEPLHDDPLPPANEPFNGRRRALMVTDETGPSEYLAEVPLPGAPDTLDLIGADMLEGDDSLELGQFDRQEFAPQTAYSAEEEIPMAGSTPPFAPGPFDPPEAESAPAASLAPPPAPAMGVFRAPVDNAPFAAPASFTSVGQPSAPFAAPPFAAAPAQPAASPAPFAMPQSAPAGAPLFAMPQPVAEAAQPPIAAPATYFAPAADAVAPAPVPQAPAPAPAPIAAMPAPFAASTQPDLATLDMVALVERFTRSLSHARVDTAPVAAPAAAPKAAPAAAVIPPFAAQMANPFASAPALQEEPPAFVPQPAFAPPPSPPFAAFAQTETALPAALAPLHFEEHDDHEAADSGFDLPFMAPAAKPFSAPGPVAAPAPASFAPFAQPEPAATAMPSAPFSQVDEHDGEAEDDDSFGSLLAMKSGFGPGREFVRIEDEDEADADGDPAEVQPVVVFPGTAPHGRAAPAPDGPTRDPAAAAPFARPAFAAPAAAAQGAPVDRAATEAALRDALVRLQQMSGAA